MSLTPRDQNHSDEFLELLTAEESRVYGLIRSMVRNTNDVEEIYQQTVTAMWENYDHFSKGTNFGAWACRIAKYRVLQFFDAQNRNRQFSDKMIDILTEAQSIEPQDVRQARLSALRKCLQSLSESDRSLVDKRYSEGLAIAAVADRLGRTSQSVCNSLRRVRQQLFRCVESRLSLGDIQ